MAAGQTAARSGTRNGWRTACAIGLVIMAISRIVEEASNELAQVLGAEEGRTQSSGNRLFHLYLAEEMDEKIARGMSADEARRRAYLKFGKSSASARRRMQNNPGNPRQIAPCAISSMPCDTVQIARIYALLRVVVMAEESAPTLHCSRLCAACWLTRCPIAIGRSWFFF